MDLSQRYEILDTIASGDFATVLRARDRELGREVAVKQIHAQFLADPQQLARYWREAQLLASLQHPNIVTIYDVVRPRGWLILELMRGSLKPRAQGEPLDLDALRAVLAAALGALAFLHANGVIHGDVKPANLLLDAQNRVKLADFGLARRAASQEGSLLRGTTKYMAPELISDQFGAVGPASDVYSLGFSAYELMCGGQFESLFPGLGTFGRDPQIAWMMWHAATDRKLPEISRVLEGVPDVLARVIQKMVAKDRAQRYRSAEEALADLTAGAPAADKIPERADAAAAAALAAAAKKKRRLRLAAVFALVLSGTICAAMLLSGQAPPPTDVHGVVAEVDPAGWKLTLISSETRQVKEIPFTRHDRFLVNGEGARLEDLRPDDQVVVRRVRDEGPGRWITEVAVTRPKIDSGRIAEIRAPDQPDQPLVLSIAAADGDAPGLDVAIPAGIEIVFNGQPQRDGRPVAPGDLLVGDRVVVQHLADQSRRKAIRVEAQRVVQEMGVLCNNVAGAEGPLRVEVGRGDDRSVQVFPFAPDCKVTINGQPSRAPTDLLQGDRVTFDHDTRVVAVNAHRTLHDTGQVERVEADRIEVALQGRAITVHCLVGPQCKITLSGEPAELSELRRGDTLEIAHDSLERDDLRPTEIAASRSADPTRWAILVGIQDYADAALGRLACPVGDATLLRDTLVRRYWIPEVQALLLVDESRARLASRIPEQLAKIGPDGKLLVYVAAHAYEAEPGDVYLAPVDFQLARADATGIRLQWLLDELEACRAGQKLLLLDCSHAGTGEDLSREPSSAEMLGTLRGPPGWAALRTVTAVASCEPGQRGLVVGDQGHGLFAWSLARGYAGAADVDRDQQIGPAELMAFLKPQMAAGSQSLQAVQTPVLVAADNRRPRLSEEAKTQIGKLAEYLQVERIDFDAVERQLAAARADASVEPEPKLLYGLVALKAKRRDLAREQFGELKLAHPNWLVPRQGTAWTWFEERGYTAGLAELSELAATLARPEAAEGPYPPRVAELLIWTGRLRQFAEIVADRGYHVPPQSLADLDAAVAALGGAAQTLYDQGRKLSTEHRLEIERQAESARQAGNLATSTQLLTVERHRLESYAAFPLDDVRKEIADSLDLRVPRY